MTEPTPTTAAAEAIARLAPREKHGQLCPVWTKQADVSRCQCWILAKAHAAVEAAAPVLLADHERQVREKVAQELLAERDWWMPRSDFRARIWQLAANIARGSQPADNGATSCTCVKADISESLAGEMATSQVVTGIDRRCPVHGKPRHANADSGEAGRAETSP